MLTNLAMATPPLVTVCVKSRVKDGLRLLVGSALMGWRPQTAGSHKMRPF